MQQTFALMKDSGFIDDWQPGTFLLNLYVRFFESRYDATQENEKLFLCSRSANTR